MITFSKSGMKKIFEILEIEPTNEEKEIKKAYAKLVKKYHPEEYPEKWKEIHEAYKMALDLAQAKREEHDGLGIDKMEPPLRLTEENPPAPVMKSADMEILPKLSQESDEMAALFDNIEELSREQLALIERCRKDRNITEDSAGASERLGYAGKKTRSVKAQGRMGGTRTFVKAVSWLLAAALSVTGMYIRISRYTGGTARQRQYEQNEEKLNRDKEIIEELQRIEEQQDKIKEELSQSIELVEMGDTREKMISLYGEPDTLLGDMENPSYEKAVYHLYGVDVEITLYIDVIMNVHYKTNQEECKGE